MNRSEVKSFLVTTFLSNFNITTALSLPNMNSFLYANGTLTTKPSNAPWVKFWIQNITGPGQYTMGAAPYRRFDRVGMIAAQVFIPENTGSKTGDELCEEIINIFEGKRFGSIVCRDSICRETGTVESNYFTYDVTIFFNFNEQK